MNPGSGSAYWRFMTTIEGLTSRSLDVPGARLHYEVRGDGPLLLVIGSPMPAADFARWPTRWPATTPSSPSTRAGLSHSTIDDPRAERHPGTARR